MLGVYMVTNQGDLSEYSTWRKSNPSLLDFSLRLFCAGTKWELALAYAGGSWQEIQLSQASACFMHLVETEVKSLVFDMCLQKLQLALSNARGFPRYFLQGRSVYYSISDTDDGAHSPWYLRSVGRMRQLALANARRKDRPELASFLCRCRVLKKYEED